MRPLNSNPSRLAVAALLSVLLSGCIAEGGYTIGGPRPPAPSPSGSSGPYPYGNQRPEVDASEGEPDRYGDPYGDRYGNGSESEAYRIPRGDQRPLTASQALGQGDAAREASMQLVISGLDEDADGVPSRALANYQRAVRLDSTNPFAYLALCRHHLEYGSPEEASAFLDQARARFEAEGRMGPGVDVWGLGLRAWVDRARGRDESANRRFRQAQALAPGIWADELLSAGELR